VLCLTGLVYSQEPTPSEPLPQANINPSQEPAKPEHSTKLEELPELPDFHVRAKELGHQLVGVQAFFEVIPGTISDHARDFPKEWTRSFGGLGKRFASQYGQFLVS